MAFMMVFLTTALRNTFIPKAAGQVFKIDLGQTLLNYFNAFQLTTNCLKQIWDKHLLSLVNLKCYFLFL